MLPARASIEHLASRLVVRTDNAGWSLYGAQRSQPVATGGKWDGPSNGSDKRKPLPWVATSCLSRSMVRRGSTSCLPQGSAIRSRRSRGDLVSFTSTATTHPALIPHEAPGSSRRCPPIPATQWPKGLLTAEIPAYPRSTRKRHDRPVTPEVAGSSPVAPVEKILQTRVFCCQHRRMRPPASRRPPAPIRDGRSAADRTPRVLQTGNFLSPVRRQARHWSAAIPRRSRARA
jgi:hypothetical protein